MPKIPDKIDKHQRIFEKVTSSRRIISFMHLLKGTANSLKATFDDSPGDFRTTLLSVDKEQKYIYLDEFFDKEANSLLLKYKVMRLFSVVNGAEFSFQVRLNTVKKHKKNIQYQMSLPNNVFYSQRRESHRVHISLDLDITASFDKDSGRTIVGQLRDISSGGMRVQFSKTDPQEFAVTTSAAPCTINIPDSSDVQCTFEVRYMRPHKRDKGCTIGVRFHKLNFAKKREIEKFMTTIERKSLRELRS